jgi:D-glycero-D-manno-heptose 1,7-bisphosphate phosphatase
MYMLSRDQVVEKAVFLDKDGTLIRDVPFNVNPSLVVFEDGVFEGLRLLQDIGFRLVIISNQSGVAKGLFSTRQLKSLISYFDKMFLFNGLKLSGFYYCPHLPNALDDGCDCCKPKPGLLLRAAEDLNIDLSQSWMVGDILNDVEAGKRAGCRTVLIDNGNETEWVSGPCRNPDYTAGSFLEGAHHIISMQTIYTNASTQTI